MFYLISVNLNYILSYSNVSCGGRNGRKEHLSFFSMDVVMVTKGIIALVLAAVGLPPVMPAVFLSL
jgi:hypothetical protein